MLAVPRGSPLCLIGVKAEAKALGLDDNQVALLKATRAADPVSALRNHATHAKEAASPPKEAASSPEARRFRRHRRGRLRKFQPASSKPQAMSTELAAAMEAVKKLLPRRSFCIRMVGARHLSAGEGSVGRIKQR